MSVAKQLDPSGIRAQAEAAGKAWRPIWRFDREDRTIMSSNDGGSGAEPLACYVEETVAAHICGMDPPTTIALVNEVERLTGLYETAVANRNFYADERKAAVARIEDAEAEVAKLRARVAELEGTRDNDHPAYVERVGWGEDDDGRPRFEALISYPSGPPSWQKADIVWSRKPVGIVLLTRGGDAR